MCPLVKIEILKGKSSEYKKAILDGVHNALVKSIKIPDHDRFQRIYELEKEDFEVPPDRTDNATLIEIKMFPGRTQEAKNKLFKTIVKNLETNPGINGNDIFIILLEPPMNNWGIRGGKPAGEVDLGFEVEV
ncbi:MAG TPA: tautomerase family protein [Methanobacteriaceae archaeon]|nr:tautomerase family protein [Methanobacteriaceae archaeon]